MRTALLLLMLSLPACGLLQPPRTQPLPAPAICLEVCEAVPDPEADLMNYSADLMAAYTDCAVKHNQCRAALIARLGKSMKGN